MVSRQSLSVWDNFPLQKLWRKRLKFSIFPQGVGFLIFFATISTGGKLSHAPGECIQGRMTSVVALHGYNSLPLDAVSDLSGYRGVMSRALSRSVGMKLTLNGAVRKVSKRPIRISRRWRCRGIEQNRVGRSTLTFTNSPRREGADEVGGSEAKW